MPYVFGSYEFKHGSRLIVTIIYGPVAGKNDVYHQPPPDILSIYSRIAMYGRPYF